MIDRRQFTGVSIFSIFQNVIENELKEIQEYINETASDLKDKQQKLEKDYEEANKEVDENAEYDAYSFFENDIYKYFKVFPVYTYNPLLLTLYGQFEIWLRKLCDFDSIKGFSKVNVNDLAGNNYIEKSRRYLKIVAEIDLEDTNSQWQKITSIQKIRNCIAHNDSNINKNKSVPIDKQELFPILINDNRIEFDKNKGDFYIKEPEFLLDTITLIKEYLINIISKLKVRRVIAKNMTTPVDNATWGQEKTEDLIKQVISSLNLIDNNEFRKDEFKDSDLKNNIKGTLESMVANLTKLLSFFSNGKWEVVDQKYIIEEREKGLEKIRQLYNIE